MKKGELYVFKDDLKIWVSLRVYKMSKSCGNVVNFDDVVIEYGVDLLWFYEMFMGLLRFLFLFLEFEIFVFFCD